MRLLDKITHKELFSELDEATTFSQRLIGLLGRKSISGDYAFCLANCNSVHMFGMRFAIDVIYLNRQDQIVKLVKNLRPWRVSMARSAVKVIETKSGMCDHLNLKVGQELTIVRL